jgi:lipopolysaccharide/colanic/teichoic acid biosynthesis glycosyltransferase
LGLLLLWPLLLACGLAVRFSSPGPILFRQPRVGRGGRLFTLLKFRSMRPGEAGPSITASGDPRITRVGRVLRASKLDELPELWNVLRGEMALVGPRPEVPTYVDLEDPRWRAVLEVRPGITDPVTVRLRGEERLLAGIAGDKEGFYRTALLGYKLDGYRRYLRERTWTRDLGVIYDTVWAVVAPHRVPSASADEILRAAAR